jgi:diguanylate cyclase (GGDEF)-like protein
VIAVMSAAYFAAVGAAAAFTPVRAGDLRLFAVLMTCTVVSIEMTRRIGEPTGMTRDVYAIFDLPAAVLLPPLYVLLQVGVRQVLSQTRVRHGTPHRRVYSAGAVGLAYAAASVLVHAAEPLLPGSGPGPGAGVRAVLWTLLVAGCGIMRIVANDALIAVAIRGANPQASLRPVMIGAEAQAGDAAELCLGMLVTFTAAHSAMVVLYALPLLIWQQRSVKHTQLVRAARIDRKTGLLNDPTWRAEAGDEVARAARTRTPLAVAILDIDHFKRVNDTYGHPAGDVVLAAVAATTTATLRDGDVVGRIGGEEFAFLLPYTEITEALTVAERLRQVIPRITVPEPSPGAPALPSVTVSIGVAAAPAATWSLDEFLRLADTALYAAKGNGRNRVFAITAGTAGAPGDLRPRPVIGPDRTSGNGNGTGPGGS